MEKLHELHDAGNFDLIVIDTPPTRHALDFLDAPRRLLRLLDNRIFRMLMMPTRAYLKVASVAVQAFLRTVARVVGSEAIDDVVAFFRAFEGMEAGFRDRAVAVEALLAAPETGFVLVTSPRRDAMEEAQFFARQLERNREEDRRADREPRASRRSATKHPRACAPPASELASHGDDPAALPPRGALREPRRLPRDRRPRARARGRRAGTGGGNGDLLRALPRPRRVRLRGAARDRRSALRPGPDCVSCLGSPPDDHDSRRRRRAMGSRPGAVRVRRARPGSRRGHPRPRRARHVRRGSTRISWCSTSRSATWAASPSRSTSASRSRAGGCRGRASCCLLDRRDDVFIARRADVDLTLVKPVDAGVLRRAAAPLLAAAAAEADAEDAPDEPAIN